MPSKLVRCVIIDGRKHNERQPTNLFEESHSRPRHRRTQAGERDQSRRMRSNVLRQDQLQLRVLEGLARMLSRRLPNRPIVSASIE